MPGEMVGSFIGNWRLTELIGIGGYAEVYRGTRPDSSQQTAIKVLKPGMAADKAIRKAFTKEINVLSGLEHAGIPRFFSEGEVKGLPAFVMQLIEGRSLRQYIDEGVFFDRVGCLLASASLLAFVHNQGVVHGDIKMENFLLQSDGRLRLIDFGNARMTTTTAFFFRRNKSVEVRGTPGYLAPELLRGKAATQQSDVYAFGVLAWNLLANRPPFTGSKNEVMKQAVQCQAPGIRRAQGAMPQGLAKAVDRCLSRDLAMRFGDAEELAMSLKIFFRQPEAPKPAELSKLLRFHHAKQSDRQVTWLDA